MAWEVDWSKKDRIKGNPVVWARNPTSSQERSRGWHWTTWACLKKNGIDWVPNKPRTGRHKSSGGYVIVAMGALSDEEKKIAEENDLFIGVARSNGWQGVRGVKEHRLVAAKKYGSLPPDIVVRHLDGNKANNDPSNLVIGTHKENSMDHHTAHMQMMYWRERALVAEGRDVINAIVF